MKIIHVLSGLTKGGGERVAVELANKAVEHGDDVVIIAGWPEKPEYLQNKIDPKIELRFVSHKKSIPYLKILPWIIKNKKWIGSYDIVHCHLTYGAVFSSLSKILIRTFNKRKNPLFVETYHAVGMSIPKFNQWIHSKMILLRDGLILMASDPYWNKFIAEHQAIKTEVIPNGISLIQPLQDKNLKIDFRFAVGIPSNCKFVVGTVGMLRPDRQPLLYIPIFKKIYEALGDDIQFIIAGGGSEFQKVKSLIETMQLSNVVHMIGIVNNPSEAISNMDLYISMSVGEAAGISMIEAAMCKLPVIGIQLNKAYAHRAGNWVWSHTDHTEVANKIIALLKNAEERNKLAQYQNGYVNDHFTSEAMYKSYYTFYQKLKTSSDINK